MSGMYINKGSERIENNELIILRNEVVNLFSNINIINNSGLTDYYGNKNFLLQNPLKEKQDNGDIDIFVLIDKKEKENIINLLLNHPQILEYTSNDKIKSVLFISETLNKKVQVDIHLIEDEKLFINSYFDYYRIPYLMFMFGVISNKINVKTSNKGIFYGVSLYDKHNNNSLKYINIENNLYKAIEKIYNISDKGIENIKGITSIKEIVNLINSLFIINYNIFNIDNLRPKYKKKSLKNDTFNLILSNIKKGTSSNYKEIREYIFSLYSEKIINGKTIIKEIKNNNKMKQEKI